MAVSDITATVLRITGVTPTANSVEDAQRFVVSSVPKELLKWAATFTVPGNHGGNTSDGVTITMPTGTDSVLDVSRNGFSAIEVPYEMKGFIANTASLHLATNTYPKYYLSDTNPGEGSKVIVKPIPTDSETAVVLYVDFSKIDDDCDLRNAVIYHTSAHEFSKLGSDELPTISVNAVPPDAPTLTSITFNSVESDVDATLPTFSTATVSAADVYTGSAPDYTKLTSTVVGGVTSFDDYTSGLSELDPGVLSVTAVPPDVPTVPDFSFTVGTSLPTYTAPSLDASSNQITEMEVGTIGSAQTDTEQWFDVVGDFIETEEDTELATAQIQKISTYLQAYSQSMQNQLNEFNTELQKYQAELQKELQEAQFEIQAENAAQLQQYQAEIQEYQAEVNTEVQEYSQKLAQYQLELNTAYQAWAKTESDRISAIQLDVQDELNDINIQNISYQSAIQESIQELQVENQRNIAAAQAELQLNMDNENRSQQRQLQNGINDMQAIVQDNQSLISKYQAESQQYSSEAQIGIAEYQNKIQKQQSYSKESDKYYQWANAEIQMYIQNNSKMINKTMAAQASAQQQRAR